MSTILCSRRRIFHHLNLREISTSSIALARQGRRPLKYSKELLQVDPEYDAVQRIDISPKDGYFGGSVSIYNDPPPWDYIAAEEQKVVDAQREKQGLPPLEKSKKQGLTSRQMIEQYDPKYHLPVSQDKLGFLHRYPIVEKRVIHQTGKGRIAQFYAMTVVGNGRGLMGYGEGKGEDINRAKDRSFLQAVRNMDTIERFEDRTLGTTLEIKFGATKVIMRPRPVGFGLQCNPNIHQVCKAAGVKDISGKVWGSRNAMNVVKAVCMLLHAGNSHLNMGDGVGGKGRRLDKGVGMRGREAMEIERGRKIVDYRTW